MLKQYLPNHIPRNERILHLIIAIFCIEYSIAGILHDDICLPSKRGK